MSPSKLRVAVIPGDGIGPEVVSEAVRVLERARETHGVELEFTHFDWGAEKFLREGVSLPAGGLEMSTPPEFCSVTRQAAERFVRMEAVGLSFSSVYIAFRASWNW